MTPARAIAAALASHGLTTQASQARAIGETPDAWNHYLQGRREPGAKKVQAWLDACAEAGAAVVLHWGQHGVSVML